MLYQESRDDEQVSNLGTRAVARALGVRLLQPAVEPIFGIDAQQPTAASAYVQWNVAPPVRPPEANVPAPAAPAGESDHDLPRHGEAFQQQVERFLRPGGEIEHTCDGPSGRE